MFSFLVLDRLITRVLAYHLLVNVLLVVVVVVVVDPLVMAVIDIHVETMIRHAIVDDILHGNRTIGAIGLSDNPAIMNKQKFALI